jgi:ABC-2 type transport system ATP-binding protein
MTPCAALEVAGLSHRFGAKEALKDVSFSLAPGEIAMLVGRNGAGKTTLISLLTRLYHASTGEILIFGASLRRDPLRALSQVGVVFQEPTLDLDLSVSENLRYHGALHGLSRRESDMRGTAMLERLGIVALAGTKVRVLSGGMRRRVEIARALMHAPRLLILDEPTVGLDTATRRGIQQDVRLFCHEQPRCVLWATHLMDEVDGSDRVLVLEDGAIVRSQTAGALQERAGARSFADAFIALTEPGR